MNDPRRLREEGDGFMRELLDSARGDAGCERAFRRGMAVFGGAGAALGTAGAAKAAGTLGWLAKSGVLSVAQWVAVGAVAGGVTVGVATTLGRPASHNDAPAAAASPSAPLQRQPLAHAPLIGSAWPQPSTSERAAAPAPCAAAADRAGPPLGAWPAQPEFPSDGTEQLGSLPALPLGPTANPTPSARVQGPSSLAEELAILDQVRAALARGDATSALRALDQREVRFPRGSLGPEAALLRVEALLSRGDEAGARALAEAFLAAHPSGPHAERMRSIIGRTIP